MYLSVKYYPEKLIRKKKNAFRHHCEYQGRNDSWERVNESQGDRNFRNHQRVHSDGK